VSFLGTKRKPGAPEAVRKSAVAAREHRDAFLKAALVAVAAVALTAGSAAISSLRQRMETRS
jgi:anti-sigma-K factor RskA